MRTAPRRPPSACLRIRLELLGHGQSDSRKHAADSRVGPSPPAPPTHAVRPREELAARAHPQRSAAPTPSSRRAARLAV
eukprot:124420-Rhodomonas_salina.1